MLSNRITEQENPLCFQLDALKDKAGYSGSLLDYGFHILHLCLLTLAVHLFPLAASGALSIHSDAPPSILPQWQIC